MNAIERLEKILAKIAAEPPRAYFVDNGALFLCGKCSKNEKEREAFYPHWGVSDLGRYCDDCGRLLIYQNEQHQYLTELEAFEQDPPSLKDLRGQAEESYHLLRVYEDIDRTDEIDARLEALAQKILGDSR